MSRHVVIVGAGAAGVYTAYRLRRLLGDAYRITVLEGSERIGGNASTLHLDGARIECGAQFFHRGAQSEFLALLGELDLLDACEVVRTAAGFTIWDRAAGRRVLQLPATVAGFAGLGPGDWFRAAKFGVFLAYAWALERWETDWTLTVDAWLGRMRLLDEGFKRRVIVPFLYQFVALPPSRIGEASAKYAVTYLVRTLFPGGGPTPDVPRIGRARPTFEAYQSLVGIAEIHRRVLAAADVEVQTNTRVIAVRPDAGSGAMVVTVDGEITADDVVLATDPHVAATVLEAGAATPSALIDGLRSLEYARLPISIQHGEPAHMPARRSDWQPFNTIVDGDALEFSVWFGPMRPPAPDGSQLSVFKSWGSPALSPTTTASEVLALQHYVPLPTADFMRAREDLLPRWQGTDRIWFAGGWTQWFDSQEAALGSADVVARGIVGVDVVSTRHTDVRGDLQDTLERAAVHAPTSVRDRLIHAIHEVEARG